MSTGEQTIPAGMAFPPASPNARASGVADACDAAADTGASDALRERLRVLLLARVLVVSVFLAAAATVYLSRDPLSKHIPTATFIAVAVAYAASLVSALVVTRAKPLEPFVLLQMVFDVLLVSGAIALAGGSGSPFVVLYGLAIANAAGLALMPGALITAGCASIAYAVLTVRPFLAGASLESPLSQIVLPISLGSAGLLVGAYVVGSLARRMDLAERELRQQGEDLHRLEGMHRALAGHLDSGVLIADPAGRVRSANDAAQQILRLGRGELLGREIGWLLPLLASVEGRENDVPGHVECEYRAAEAGVRRLRVKRAPLTDTYGNPIGELLMIQDVTRLLELESRLAAQDEIESRIQPYAPDPDLEEQDGLIGGCTAMRSVSNMISKVAAAEATVLVLGESGTGKELVARAIHRRSARAQGSFVVVNCGAIPENLIESELFGHVRGAFTGAVSDRPGLFRRANHGTIFLDEIGELPLHLQVRLLRVLQDHTVMPVGGTAPVAVDVRVVAATNRDLAGLVKAGKFREDLYYRLAVISIEMPPLRERGEDLKTLIAHFVHQASERRAKRIAGLSTRTMQLLLRHSYPGNVRELENVIEHAATLADGDTIREADLPEGLRDSASRVAPALPQLMPAELALEPEPIAAMVEPSEAAYSIPSLAESRPVPLDPELGSLRLPIDGVEEGNLDEQLARREKEMLLAALARAAGVKKKAATLLGINYRSFRHRLQKYGLDGHGDDSERMILPRGPGH